ncbi:MAG: Linear gramicidin synthase subunit [Nocardia sp.]|uniref:AMP-binding protein n=1 Tax=Nocardia sp. TaxID=1821 RepID=UPI00260320D8|nr:AMP-binding protein [Nocardia sp.]MCU1640108.1 Linear gramicidin synthase subunit [Nocardia sp.]
MCKPVESPATTTDELTPIELDRWSNRLARMLVHRGVRPGDRVAIVHTPQLESIVARLAITKTGATPVPYTTEATASRADFGVTTKAGMENYTDAGRWLVLDDRSTLVQYLTGSDAPLTAAELHPALLATA